MRQNLFLVSDIIQMNSEVIFLETVIYADILVAINMIVNYFLLRSSAALIKCEHKTSRFLISSFAGGLFSLIIFVENMKPVLYAAYKLLTLIILVLIAFKIKSLKAFLKCTGAFFLSNFIFAGIMLAVSAAILPNASIYKNGVVYFDLNIFTLSVISVICYLIIEIISRFTKSKVPEKCIYDIGIHYEGISVDGKALYDSGNTLCDCFSGKPVIICEKSFLMPLLDGKELTDMKNFRLIPFSTIKNGGALPAFLAEKVTIRVAGITYNAEKIYVAITEKKIISGGYSALVGMPFFDLIDNKTISEKEKILNEKN